MDSPNASKSRKKESKRRTSLGVRFPCTRSVQEYNVDSEDSYYVDSYVDSEATKTATATWIMQQPFDNVTNRYGNQTKLIEGVVYLFNCTLWHKFVKC